MAAKPDLWDSATYGPTHGHQICVTGMLEDFGGHTEVMIYPKSAILLQMAVVLASLISSLTNAG